MNNDIKIVQMYELHKRIGRHHISSMQTSASHTCHHHPSASFICCTCTHTHTHTATVQDMSGSIKHLNARAVKQIAGIQQGRVGSKSRDRITPRRGGDAGQVRRAMLIFSLRIRIWLSLSLRMFQLTQRVR